MKTRVPWARACPNPVPMSTWEARSDPEAPHRIFVTFAPYTLKQGGIFGDSHLRSAEFTMVSALNLATKLVGHCLFAIANSKDRQPGIIDCLGRHRSVFIKHGSRPTRKDDRFRIHIAKGSFRFLERHDLAIDLFLTYPASDELGDLGTKVDDQNLVVHGRHLAPERW